MRCGRGLSGGFLMAHAQTSPRGTQCSCQAKGAVSLGVTPAAPSHGKQKRAATGPGRHSSRDPAAAARSSRSRCSAGRRRGVDRPLVRGPRPQRCRHGEHRRHPQPLRGQPQALAGVRPLPGDGQIIVAALAHTAPRGCDTRRPPDGHVKLFGTCDTVRAGDRTVHTFSLAKRYARYIRRVYTYTRRRRRRATTRHASTPGSSTRTARRDWPSTSSRAV